jgi:hypothetical protein
VGSRRERLDRLATWLDPREIEGARKFGAFGDDGSQQLDMGRGEDERGKRRTSGDAGRRRRRSRAPTAPAADLFPRRPIPLPRNRRAPGGRA